MWLAIPYMLSSRKSAWRRRNAIADYGNSSQRSELCIGKRPIGSAVGAARRGFALNNVLRLSFLGQPPLLVAALAAIVPPLLGSIA